MPAAPARGLEGGIECWSGTQSRRCVVDELHIDEGVTPPNGLHLLRNFENAATAARAKIEGPYPGWCKTNR
jgi:hypothetical protein